jgi:hypothetical protein
MCYLCLNSSQLNIKVIMNLQLLTDATPLEKKEWAKLVVYSVLTQFPAMSLVQSFNGGLILAMSDVQTNSLPDTTGGNLLSYSPTIGEVVISGLAGGNTACFSTDGVTFTQITTAPTSTPYLKWSPLLGYYGYIDGNGPEVYTSVDHVTYVIGTPAPGSFGGLDFIWSTVFNKFFADSLDAVNRVYASSDGKSYTAQASNRDIQGFAESKELGLVVAVGDNGPQYTNDGLTWHNSTSTFSASDVAWSPSWGAFVTVPRNGTKTECWRSSDGINWTVTHPFSGSTNIRCCLWSQDLGIFIAGGDNAYLAFSLDGFTWLRSSVTGSEDFYGCGYVSQWGEYFMFGIGGSFVSNTKVLAPGA